MINSSKKEGKESRITLEEAKNKIARYCAYQERAHYEVEQKLYSYGLWEDDRNELLAWLITENYLNEERFAIAFAGGKFRMKKWGRIKIKSQLKQKRVSSYSINKALNMIDVEEYAKTIEQLVSKKASSINANTSYELLNKVARYVISKGFEPEQVWEVARTILK